MMAAAEHSGRQEDGGFVYLTTRINEVLLSHRLLQAHQERGLMIVQPAPRESHQPPHHRPTRRRSTAYERPKSDRPHANDSASTTIAARMRPLIAPSPILRRQHAVRPQSPGA